MLVDLEKAVSFLRDGKLVAIPTETVYGLAADAQNDEALTLLYRTKGRPQEHPVILHVADLAMCRPFVREIPWAAQALMEAFWPGPLTLLLPKSDLVSLRITGGRPLVGVRAPATPLALELLRRLGKPLVAPSANRFGHISPTTADHVEQEFEGEVAVLDGGPCGVGLESTIVAIEDDRLVVLRPGQLPWEKLEEVSGLPVVGKDSEGGVPGALKSHYAPRQPLKLVPTDELLEMPLQGTAVLALSEGPWFKAVWAKRLPYDSAEYARELYAALREAEASGCEQILLELPPRTSDWKAVHDRLRRAAAI